MPLITLNDISIKFSDKKLLSNANATILKGDKIALIGRNGAGKSTLMRILAGSVDIYDGEIKIKNNIKISYLEQTTIIDNKIIFDIVASGLGDIGSMLINYKQLMAANSLDKAAKIQEKIDALNAWEYLHKIEKILNRFALHPNDTLSSLSGGWQKKVMLAQALISEPDILLLDEPTNHMDIKSILYLEKILINYHAALVLITHDRALVRAVVNKIFDIDRAKLAVFNCNYDSYIKHKNNILDAEEVHAKLFAKKLANEEVWIRKGIKARRTRNEGRVRALITMREDAKQRISRQGQPKITAYSDAEKAAKIVFSVRKVSYSIKDNMIVDNFSTLILKGDKIGIVGKNGIGKSSFIKLLLGKLDPSNGSIKRAKNIKLAYFEQIHDKLPLNKTAMDFVAQGRSYISVGGKDRHVIGYLRQFLFDSKQAMSPIKMLSGGEKNRLILAKILANPTNLLVLDEPTNDLDVETLELLEEMLINYMGTLIVISHDRAFLNNIVSSTIVIEQGGKFTQYAGNYDDFLLQKQNITKKINTDKLVIDKKNNIKISKKPSYKQQQELKQLLVKIEQTETKIKSLQQTLTANFIKNQGNESMIELSKQEQYLKLLYDRWYELDN